MRVWPTLMLFLERDEAAALITVVEAQGSTPREAGARMVVRADGAFSGTIGGGTLEWLVLAEAQRLLDKGEAVAVLDKALGPDLGQCCGGRAVVRIERFTRADRGWMAPLAAAEAEGLLVTASRRDASGRFVRERVDPAVYEGPVETFGEQPTPLVIFGAGHVGRALALALAPLPFAVTWVDGRPNVFPTHVPANVTCVALADPAPVLAEAQAGTLVAVMTHSHALDLAVVSSALPDHRFPYVGLIGSRTKRARFSRQMRDAGLAPEVVGRLVCPIGLTNIRSKEPAVIAAGVAAQLLIERERAIAHAAPPRRLTADGGQA